MTRRKPKSHRKGQQADEGRSKEEPVSGAKAQSSPASLTAFYEQYRTPFNAALLILLILIPLFLAVLFRSYTADLAAADIWAEQSTDRGVKDIIRQVISQNYPTLPAANINEMVNEQYRAIVEDGETFVVNTDTGPLTLSQEFVEQRREQTAAQFRAEMKTIDGQTYLLAIDPYQFLRLTENIIDHGHPGDYLKDGRPFNDHKRAPLGTFIGTNFHSWFGAKLHGVVNIFTEKSPMAVFFWIPVIFASLAVIPAFLLGWRKAGLLAGFFTATLVAVHAGFVGRTAAGFSDTDAYVILFPLLAGWLLLEAFETPWGEWKRRLAYLAAASFTFGLFSFAWGKWWYFFDVFLIALVAYVGFLFVRYLVQGKPLQKFLHDDQLKGWLFTLLGFILLTFVFVSLFSSPRAFLVGPLSALEETTEIKAAMRGNNLWPNVYTTVAELNAPSINAIINSIGGDLLFVIALLGVLATMVSPKKLLLKDWLLLAFGLLIALYLVGKGTGLSIITFLIIMALPVGAGFLLLLKDDRGIDVKYALFLFAWLAASVFTMTKGVRFVLLLIPPFAIAAGIAVATAYSLLKEWLVKEVNFSPLWVAPLLFLLFSLLLVQPVVQGHQTGLQEAPSMSDAWWNALTKIKEESQPDAIINSWWDFGHWFKYVADRAVTFDGASQNTPMAHWVGRALITDNEKETLGILRMLDCGSQQGVIDIQEGLPGNDDYEAIMLAKRIIMLNPEDARAELLAAGISAEQAEVVLNHTHCEPPENYFITSGDMVGKAGVWGHFGSWDFAKADAYKNLRRLDRAAAISTMTEKYNWSEDRASETLYKMETLSGQDEVNAWISPWPGYPMSSWRRCDAAAEQEDVLVCPMQVTVSKQGNQQTVLDFFLINTTNTSNSFPLFTTYDSRGQALGSTSAVQPSQILFAYNDSYEGVVNPGADFGQAFMVDMRGGMPRVLLMDSLHANSIFMRLFFMDGWNTQAFEKFAQEQSVNMGKIVVWKVDWSKLDEWGMA